MSNKLARIQEIRESKEKINGFVIGTLKEIDSEGRISVSWTSGDDNTERRNVSAMQSMEKPVSSKDLGRKVILGFENGEPDHPILFGFLESTQRKDTVELLPAPDATTEIPESLHLKSGEELILECGKAKISLRADGRIVILGGYLVSRSTGVNKIKGGSVQIN